MAAYEVLLLNTAIPQIQAAQAGDTYVVPRDIAITGALTANGGAVFNENGANVDFRVEGDTDANLLFVDASADFVGIGTNAPEGKLHVANIGTAGTTADNLAVYFTSTNRNANVYIRAKNTEGSVLNFADSDNASVGRIAYEHSDNSMRFDVNGAEKMRLASAAGGVGALGIGYTSLTSVGDSGLAVLGNVGIGTNAPAAKIEVSVGRAATVNSGIFSTSGTGVVGDQNRVLVKNVNTAAGANYGVGIGGYLEASASNKASLLLFYDSGTATTEGARLDSSGNLGLGVTPSAWVDRTALEGSYGGALSFDKVYLQTALSSNCNYNGTNWLYKLSGWGATRYELGDISNGSAFHKWYVAPSGTAGNAISFTQAMTLDASGRLLVGTTTSSNRTITVGAASASIALADANGGIYFGATGTPVGSGGFGENAGIARAGGTNFHISGSVAGDLCIAPEGTKAILFGTSASASSVTERARITSGGDLFVGTTVDTWTTTKGFYCFYQSATNVTRDGAEAMNLNRLTNDGTIMGFRRSGTEVGTISVTTTATAYNTSSDYRLKDNPQPLTNSGAFIDALKPKTWNWKSDGSKGVGFIAHEVQEVSPGSVVGTKDAVDADGKPVMQAMEYGSAEFIANIVAELQSLRARVAQLEQGA